MLISIIIPTYNRSQTLTKKITDYCHALDRNAKKYGCLVEKIIVNDASTDNTRIVCNALQNQIPNLITLNLETNLGPGPARNEGVRAASGQYIWFIDDDDDLKPNALNEIFAYIKSKPDLITHSLNKNHSNKDDLINAILLFQEKQEVFNCIIKRQIITDNDISFGNYLHEDISYLVKIINASQNIINLKTMVINKNETRGAITEKMSTKRIDGYIKSYMDVINSIKITEEFKLKLHTSYLGVMLYLIQNTPIEDALNLIRYLRDQDFTQIEAVKKTKYRRTSTNFEYANKVFLKSLSKKTPDILDEIKKVFSTYLSCKDLEQSLFLGPNEIRACCKRFFVSGEQKGDVVLLPANEKITYEDITKSKKSLVQEINTGTSTECSGCPYIDRYETSKRVNQINYISFENFSYCNMRCTYCSPKYYGGAEAEYDSLSIIDQLFQRPDELSDQVHVVFGGGEPTLSPKFIEINSILKDNPKISKVRILSNSLKYNANVTKLIQNNKYQLVTSIDAGSQEMFTEIRQRGEIAKVFSNLKTYSHHLDDKQRLTVKYIITSQNYKTSELISYIELIKQYDLIDCLFQISCDFMVECPKTDMTIACYELSALLYEAGAQHVFFDDLIRDRIKISDDLAVLIHNKLCTVNTHYDQSGETSYIIWGKGLQANWISQNTMIGRSGHIQATVSDEKELNDLIQKKSLQQDKIKIIPAGVQSTYEIIQNIKLAGFEKNIINSVLL